MASTLKGCNKFRDTMEAFMEHVRSFSVSYNVTFANIPSVDIRNDIMSINFINGTSDSTYKRYILLSKYCQRRPDLLPFIKDLNEREPLPSLSSVVEICLANLLEHYLDTADPFVVMFCI